MGYQALLFCPDEKTARTVTQVLGELEFTVEACSEPFAAVKKLMGEHFDAVVVDCDNEQNATLLFKSARNSTSNQTSLAVAVVEGQAGVAKAFRIGANLVLTKPINIEQAKGTLRVARGLLRKAEPGKPAAAAPSVPAAPAAPAAPPKPVVKPVLGAKPAGTGAPSSLPPVPKNVPLASPVPPAAFTAVATTEASRQIETTAAQPVAMPPAAPEPPVAIPASVSASAEKTPEIPKPFVPAASAPNFSTSGAASAPAPAREVQVTKAEPVVDNGSAAAAKPIEAAMSQSAAITGSAPTFSYGASTETSSGGGSKKIFIGVGLAAAIGVAAFFGWNQFKGHGSQPGPAAAAVGQPASTPAGSITPSTTPAASSTPTEPVETAKAVKPEASVNEPSGKESPSHSTAKTEKAEKNSVASTSVASKAAEAETPEPEPLVVKAGKEPAHTKSTAADAAPAPSMIGMATPESAPLVPTPTDTFKPRLQTLSISQGVSQGLLYKKVAPTYPPSALRMRIEGVVELMATISKEGNITQVKTLSGDRQLAKAASDAVKQWKYKPYLLNGEPVEIQTQITVNFKLPN